MYNLRIDFDLQMDHISDACYSCCNSNCDAGPSRQESIDEAFELINSLDDFNDKSSSLTNNNYSQLSISGTSDAVSADLPSINRIVQPGINTGELLS